MTLESISGFETTDKGELTLEDKEAKRQKEIRRLAAVTDVNEFKKLYESADGDKEQFELAIQAASKYIGDVRRYHTVLGGSFDLTNPAVQIDGLYKACITFLETLGGDTSTWVEGKKLVGDLAYLRDASVLDAKQPEELTEAEKKHQEYDSNVTEIYRPVADGAELPTDEAGEKSDFKNKYEEAQIIAAKFVAETENTKTNLKGLENDVVVPRGGTETEPEEVAQGSLPLGRALSISNFAGWYDSGKAIESIKKSYLTETHVSLFEEKNITSIKQILAGLVATGMKIVVGATNDVNCAACHFLKGDQGIKSSYRGQFVDCSDGSNFVDAGPEKVCYVEINESVLEALFGQSFGMNVVQYPYTALLTQDGMLQPFGDLTEVISGSVSNGDPAARLLEYVAFAKK